MSEARQLPTHFFRETYTKYVLKKIYIVIKARVIMVEIALVVHSHYKSRGVCGKLADAD